MTPRPLTRAEARLLCAAALVTALMCAGMCMAAVLAPAPVAAVPFIAFVCICCPMLAAWELPAALATLRGPDRDKREAVAQLRRVLDRLPEVEHPLGL
jgi:hypothetical protein